MINKIVYVKNRVTNSTKYKSKKFTREWKKSNITVEQTANE